MEHIGKTVMKEIVAMDYGDLKEFAALMKAKLYMTTPSEADFINAIYEAAKKLGEDDEPAE